MFLLVQIQRNLLYEFLKQQHKGLVEIGKMSADATIF